MKKHIALCCSLLLLALVGQAIRGCAQGNREPGQVSGTVIPMDETLFRERVFDYTDRGAAEWKYRGELPAVIDFYASWCGPCRQVAPLLKELAKEYEGRIVVYKVDTDAQPELSTALGIRSLPTIFFIPRTGQPQYIVGATGKDTLRRAIEEVLLKE